MRLMSPISPIRLISPMSRTTSVTSQRFASSEPLYASGLADRPATWG